MDRWLQAFLVPMAALAVTVGLIVGIGLLLLGMPHEEIAHLSGTPVLLSVLVALGLAVVVLIGASVAARGGDTARK